MLEFRKFHGLGNDFILVDGQDVDLSRDEIIALCDRHRGVGADGILIVTLLQQEPTPIIRMVIFNQDGSRPEMCGNGVRCVAAYASQMWSIGDEMVIESDAGPRRCKILEQVDSHWQVAVDMGEVHVDETPATLEIEGRAFSYHLVDTGNPHAVIIEQPGLELIDRAGRLANDAHPQFEEGVNLEFVKESTHGFEVVVYERGVGRTRACGTGACAVAAAAWQTKRASVEDSLSILLPGGPLLLEWRDGHIWMTGEARAVFDGRWPNR